MTEPTQSIHLTEQEIVILYKVLAEKIACDHSMNVTVKYTLLEIQHQLITAKFKLSDK